MNKSDLKTGMRVILQNGETYMVIRDCECSFDNTHKFIFIQRDKPSFLYDSDYDNDLRCRSRGMPQLDVIAIGWPTKSRCVNSSTFCSNEFFPMETRQPRKQMTQKQIEEMLGYEIDIIK